MGILAAYDALVAAGELQPDAAQRAAASQLQAVQSALEAAPVRGSILWRMTHRKPAPIAGAYLWGGVGRGKSMLMDLFFARTRIARKQRVHFHAFMIDVHARLRTARDGGRGDPIGQVAAAIAGDVHLLAFDEMVVTNSADAMIVSRLFTALIAGGVTVVATSNRPPADLYKDGLNREHFLPFIDLIAANMAVIALDGPTDYRRGRLGDGARWFVPADAAATAALSAAFFRLTDYPPEDKANVPALELAVGGGRSLYVPKALKGVAVLSFKRLCGAARGASDYLALARTFHTIIIVGIPRMAPENRNEAARFVTLVDALYEYRVKLLASAAAPPDALYVAGDGAFEFERTASRLVEMQSDDWLALSHGIGESASAP